MRKDFVRNGVLFHHLFCCQLAFFVYSGICGYKEIFNVELLHLFQAEMYIRDSLKPASPSKYLRAVDVLSNVPNKYPNKITIGERKNE